MRTGKVPSVPGRVFATQEKIRDVVSGAKSSSAGGGAKPPQLERAIGGWLKRGSNARQSLRYKLQREAVRQDEGAVVTHYGVAIEWVAKEGKIEGENSRITHTWMKVDGRWKIITGMSAPVGKPESRWPFLPRPSKATQPGH